MENSVGGVVDSKEREQAVGFVNSSPCSLDPRDAQGYDTPCATDTMFPRKTHNGACDP